MSAGAAAVWGLLDKQAPEIHFTYWTLLIFVKATAWRWILIAPCQQDCVCRGSRGVGPAGQAGPGELPSLPFFSPETCFFAKPSQDRPQHATRAQNHEITMTASAGAAAVWGLLDKQALENCLGVVLLALSLVMAGTGHLKTFKLIRGAACVPALWHTHTQA